MPITDTKISHKIKRCASYLRAITKNNNNPDYFENLIPNDEIKSIITLSPGLIEEPLSVIDYSQFAIDTIDKYSHYLGEHDYKIIIPNRIREIRSYAFHKASNKSNTYYFFCSGKFDHISNANTENEEFYMNNDINNLPHSLYFAGDIGLDENDTIYLYGKRSTGYTTLDQLEAFENKSIHDQNISFLTNRGVNFYNIHSFTENENQDDWSDTSIGLTYTEYKHLIPTGPNEENKKDYLDLYHLSEFLTSEDLPNNLEAYETISFINGQTGYFFKVKAKHRYRLPNGAKIWLNYGDYIEDKDPIFPLSESECFYYPLENREIFIPNINQEYIEEYPLLSIGKINNKLMENNLEQQYVYKYLGKYDKADLEITDREADNPNGSKLVINNIKNYCFYQQSYLESITISQDANIPIGKGAFRECTSLQTANLLGMSKGTLRGGIFNNCSNLSSVILNPEKITGFSGHAFYGCQNLTNIKNQNNNEAIFELSKNYKYDTYNYYRIYDITTKTEGERVYDYHSTIGRNVTSNFTIGENALYNTDPSLTLNFNNLYPNISVNSFNSFRGKIKIKFNYNNQFYLFKEERTEYINNGETPIKVAIVYKNLYDAFIDGGEIAIGAYWAAIVKLNPLSIEEIDENHKTITINFGGIDS